MRRGQAAQEAKLHTRWDGKHKGEGGPKVVSAVSCSEAFHGFPLPIEHSPKSAGF